MMDKLQLIKALLSDDSPCADEQEFPIGEHVLIRTVTHFHTGRVTKVTTHFVWLEDAAWIADTGRFADALTKCEFSEVEPFKNPVRVGIGAIIDITPWDGQLPREQK